MKRIIIWFIFLLIFILPISGWCIEDNICNGSCVQVAWNFDFSFSWGKSGGGIAPVSGNMLIEIGDKLLLENNDKMLLEG